MRLCKERCGRRVLAAGLLWLVGILAFPAAADNANLPPFMPSPKQGAFLILTDIHFDPFEGPDFVRTLDAAPVKDWAELFRQHGKTALSPYGKDSNYALMTSALGAAATTGQRYDFILVAGDLLSHGFQQNAERVLGSAAKARQFATKTTVFVAREIQDRFPAIPVIPAIGNNDGDCGDYGIEPRSRYLQRLAETWRVFKENDAAARAYASFGSYSLPHPTVRKHRLIVVNDVYLSTEYVDVCDPDDEDPGQATLRWLERQLARAAQAGEKVTFLFHIPPGPDGFASSSGGAACTVEVPLWKPQYLGPFLQLARRYRDVIAAGIAGHLHTDGFRLLGADTKRPFLPIHVAPSVSPIFANNPAFTIFLYERAGGANLDYAVFFLQLDDEAQPPQWRLEYKFSDEYGFKRVDASTMRALSRKIEQGEPLAQAFKRNFDVRAPQTTTPSAWRSSLCAQVNMTKPAFIECRCAP